MGAASHDHLATQLGGVVKPIHACHLKECKEEEKNPRATGHIAPMVLPVMTIWQLSRVGSSCPLKACP